MQAAAELFSYNQKAKVPVSSAASVPGFSRLDLVVTSWNGLQLVLGVRVRCAGKQKLLRPCLVTKNQKLFMFPCHIESYGTCMEH